MFKRTALFLRSQNSILNYKKGKNIATEGVGTQTETEEAGTTDGNENALEPEIQVADQTFATAEATHPVSVEDETSAAGADQADGAFGNEEPTETSAQIEQSPSEDTTEATATNVPDEAQKQEESNEAVAS